MHNPHYPSEVGRSPVASTRAFHPALAAVEVPVAGPHTPAPVARDALPRPLDLASTADRPAAAGASVRALVDVPPTPGRSTVSPEGVGVPDRAGHVDTVGAAANIPARLTLLESVHADDRQMARLGRRPSMTAPQPASSGTWSLTVRMPIGFKDHVSAAAADQGLSCSDVIANAIAAELDLPQVMAPRASADQAELLAS